MSEKKYYGVQIYKKEKQLGPPILFIGLNANLAAYRYVNDYINDAHKECPTRFTNLSTYKFINYSTGITIEAFEYPTEKILITN